MKCALSSPGQTKMKSKELTTCYQLATERGNRGRQFSPLPSRSWLWKSSNFSDACRSHWMGLLRCLEQHSTLMRKELAPCQGQVMPVRMKGSCSSPSTPFWQLSLVSCPFLSWSDSALPVPRDVHSITGAASHIHPIYCPQASA